MPIYTYYITLRRRGNFPELRYYIGGESELTAVLKLSGKYSEQVFSSVVGTLARCGGCVPVKVSGEELTYGIREDLGPIVGAYLILVRRSRDVERWGKFLAELVEGEHVGVAKAFTVFLEVAIEMSRAVRLYSPRRRERYALAPHVLDALSSALKQFVNKLTKYHRVSR